MISKSFSKNCRRCTYGISNKFFFDPKLHHSPNHRGEIPGGILCPEGGDSLNKKIEIFLKQLSKTNELLTEFDEGLWNTTLDSMTVYSYDKVLVLFKDGSKVEWEIEK